MGVWQLNEAKTRLSEVIENAYSDGPQIITRHGAERAVILSMPVYHSLLAQRPRLRDHLLGGPKVDHFTIRRSRDTGRKINL